jgi:hypothetical protein
MTGNVRGTGLDHPRAVDILTAEHWSLLSTRSLGYQEMFGRTTIYVAILSGVVVALALVAQATRFGRETLTAALLLIAVALFVGLVTFARCVAINYEDAVWVAGMSLLRKAYLEIAPELAPYFVSAHGPKGDPDPLRHGSRQRLGALGLSLTTTSGVVGVLNSVLVGSLVSDAAALLGATLSPLVLLGVAASLVSAVLHVHYAARFRRRHAPTARAPA